jgi:glycine betaine/proline transport system permease protein/glycine betaine/proline transport system substrate-binding protein
MTGDVDVVMEEWTDNIPTYNADRDAGKFVELGINFNDNYQGFYIPRYVADANPGLKTVRDLKDYAFLFTDPEEPSKGRIFGGIPGWAITEIMEKKVTVYGLDGSYNYVVPGSNAALDAALVSAYDRKEPVVSYYWEPTWLLGSYDFVLLQDDPYDAERFPDGFGAAPSVTVTIAVSNAFAKTHPDLCAFLSRYHLSSPLISEALAYMKDTGADHASTARWLLGEHPELLSSWLDGDDLAKAKAALEGNAVVEKKGWLDFPVTLPLNTAKVDQSVRNSASQSSAGGGQKFLSGLVGFFSWILSHLPWFVIISGVGVLGWRSQKSVVKGVVYALLVSVIGLLGLWSEMLTTLSIVLASVPVGVGAGASHRSAGLLFQTGRADRPADSGRHADDAGLRLFDPGVAVLRYGRPGRRDRHGDLRHCPGDPPDLLRHPERRSRGGGGGGRLRFHPMADAVEGADSPGASHHHDRRQPDVDDGHGDGGHLLDDRGAGSGHGSAQRGEPH